MLWKAAAQTELPCIENKTVRCLSYLPIALMRIATLYGIKHRKNGIVLATVPDLTPKERCWKARPKKICKSLKQKPKGI